MPPFASDTISDMKYSESLISVNDTYRSDRLINILGYDRPLIKLGVGAPAYPFIHDLTGIGYIGMRLPGLPKRPNKTTRLDVKLQYISQDECEIMVTDLGFGEMFPSSGKVWKETTRW